MVAGKPEHLVEGTLSPNRGGPHVGIQLALKSYCAVTVPVTSCCHLEIIKSLVGKCCFQGLHFRFGLILIYQYYISLYVHDLHIIY